MKRVLTEGDKRAIPRCIQVGFFAKGLSIREVATVMNLTMGSVAHMYRTHMNRHGGNKRKAFPVANWLKLKGSARRNQAIANALRQYNFLTSCKLMPEMKAISPFAYALGIEDRRTLKKYLGLN